MMDTTCHTAQPIPESAQPDQARLLLYGEPLDCLKYLAALVPHEHDSLGDQRVQTMVVGICVRDTHDPRQALRRQLRAARDSLTRPLRTHPLVRHLFYIVELPSDSPSLDRSVNAVSSAICAHHAEIEMRHGRNIYITGIVATPHTDPVALAARVSQRATTAPIEGYYAVPWEQIINRSVADAAAEALL